MKSIFSQIVLVGRAGLGNLEKKVIYSFIKHTPDGPSYMQPHDILVTERCRKLNAGRSCM